MLFGLRKDIKVWGLFRRDCGFGLQGRETGDSFEIIVMG
jgi:hypothetical protein